MPIVLVNKNKFEITLGKGKFLGKLEKCDVSQILNIKTSSLKTDLTASKLVNANTNSQFL
jgi:hypothetical protein